MVRVDTLVMFLNRESSDTLIYKFVREEFV